MKTLSKPILWTIFLSLVFFYCLHFIEKKTINYDSNGVAWAEINPKLIVALAQENYIFILENRNESVIHSYKIISQHKSYSPSRIYHYTIPVGKYSINQIFEDTYNETFNNPEVINLNYEQLKLLVSSSEKAFGREIILNEESNDLISLIENSITIFLLISFIIVLFLGFYHTIRFFVFDKNKVVYRYIFDVIIIIVLIGLLFTGLTPDWYVSNKLSALSQYFISIFPVYLLFQWILVNFDKGSPSLAQLIILRFTTLLFGSIFFVFMGCEIGKLLDIYVFKGSDYTGIAFRTKLSFGLGVGYAFALADSIIFSTKGFIEKIRLKTS